MRHPQRVPPHVELDHRPGSGVHPGPTTIIHLRCADCGRHQVRRAPGPEDSGARLERLRPRVPVRHWVFSLGASASPPLALGPRVHRRVARACVAAVLAGLRRAAARAGIIGPTRGGALSVIHPLGVPLEPSVRVHALVLDGVYSDRSRPGSSPEFLPLPAPRRRDLRRLRGELQAALESILARASSRSRAALRAPPQRDPERPPDRPGPLSARTRVVHRATEGPRAHPVHPLEPSGALVEPARERRKFTDPPAPADDPSSRAPRPHPVAVSSLDPGALDPGTLDPGALDPGALDPGALDSGALDPGTLDSGAVDPGALDSGALDSGALDPGALDPGLLVSGSTGRLRHRLPRPFADGTTHVEFSTHALADRLLMLTKGSGRLTLEFHGVLALTTAARTTRARPLSLPRLAGIGAARSHGLHCCACQGLLDIVKVEPAERAA